MSLADGRFWHFCDMHAGTENVCSLGQTGSDGRAARTTRLTVRPEGANYQ